MSNAIQLALNQGLAPQAAPWGGGPLGAPPPGGGGGGETSALTKVHRLLRGRYLLAIVLGLVCAAGGAVAGFMSQKPAYKSTGLIEIDPKVPNPQDVDKVMTLVGNYVQSQMIKLQSEQVVRFAMGDKRWQKLRPGPVTDAAVQKFDDGLTVALPPKSQLFIQVTYTDDAKDAKDVAPVAVACVIDAYFTHFAAEEASDVDTRVKYWVEQQKFWNGKIEENRRKIEDIAPVGDDDPLMVKSRNDQLVLLQKTLREAQEMLASAEQDLKAALENGDAKPTVEDWARVDPTMEGHVKLRNELMMRMDALKAQLGENHQAVVRSRQELETRQQYMNKYADELNAKFVIRWSPDGTGGKLIPRDLSGLRASVKRLKDTCDSEEKTVKDLRTRANKVATCKEEMEAAKAKLREVDNTLRVLEFQKQNVERIKVLQKGTVAAPDKDRRPMFAAVGFLGGFSLPVGLLMLIGLLDSRYRYSDDATAASAMNGLTLLGILPNLPDRLSDPEQAAIAAHCVHQIRTMLQINGGPEERRVFAVTSASPGDGKTSLTLALGLSYAACGTRTLLIDCDLVGAGLSSRMNVNAAEGVLEAIASRSLLPFVRTTDVADVAVLPVGSAGNLHASTLSPQALRRLIEEAEKHFDTIMIDTGPVLGSIEASLVCAAADAVILTVARGQQRPMVEKSLGHLTAIGARLAGVVFNRAQAQDFERSISGVSMRSVGLHGRRGTDADTRYGPVARAVATHVPGADGEGDDAGTAFPPPVGGDGHEEA